MRRHTVVGIVLALLALAAPAAEAADPTRYSLAGGCYALTGPAGQPVPGGEKLRLQATALGRYLLYRPDRAFLAAQDGGPAAPAQQPSPAADWQVEEAGGGAFTLRPGSSPGSALAADGTLAPAPGDATRLRFAPADGCAVFPEASLDATGRPGPAPTEYGKVGGLLEGHMHWMTFQYFGGRFHCGRPWHPYGIPAALPDCSEVEGPQGTAAPFQNLLNYGNPGQPHDTSGYPKLTEWSKDNLTYEGTYYRWIERAYLGGLRLMVMGINENRILCETQQNRTESCNEMTTVRRGFKALRELQDYVDAQAGGPGKGFFQIVTDPFEARKVVNQGRMAVVMEIEISEPFDCANVERPTCDQAQVDRQLDEMHKLGVRSMLLLNKFDNPLAGVRFDGGPTGTVINAGNRASAGRYWDARTCTGKLRDNTIFQPEPGVAASLNQIAGTLGLPSGGAPAYPPPPHCNTRGLTDLGRHLVRRMMDLKMIVNPDHMSQAGVDQTLDQLEKRRYSGVISPHGWMDPGNWPRLWNLGGLAFPGHSSAGSYVKEWKEFRPRQTPYDFGWGYGADLGGLSHQPGLEDDSGKISYPFKSYDGKVTFERQKTGDRTFDYTKEGVAHYGLYPDWFEDLRRMGGQAMADDMWQGAEAYLAMWERAEGVRAPGCAAPRKRALGPRGLAGIRLGADWRSLLRSAGQPQQRGRAWTWCVKGKFNRRAADVAVLSRGGRVQLVGSTARGRRPLDRNSRTRVGARTRRSGLRVRRAGRVAEVSVARAGRIRAIAVVSRSLARRPKALRAAVRTLIGARATQRKRTFVDSTARAASSGRPTGRSLAGTGTPKLDAALALLCQLQVSGYEAERN